jgi:hypothetical protein
MYALSNAFFKFLGKSAGVQTERDHDQTLQDFWQEKGSRHLSYLFQHTKLTHEDGSLSLNEMLSHGERQPGKFERCTGNAMKILAMLILPISRLLFVAGEIPSVFSCLWHMSFAIPINPVP